MKKRGEKNKRNAISCLNTYPNNRRPKTAQITIFIILGIIIIASVIAILFFSGKFKVTPETKLNPNQYAEKCIKDAVESSIQKALDNGGIMEPKLTVLYEDDTYTFLCHSPNVYEFCENKYPMLKSVVEEEIRKDSKAKIEACLLSLKTEFQKEGYSITDNPITKYEIELIPSAVSVKIDKKITLTKSGQTSSIENFNMQLSSPLYDLIEVARDIINGETQDCYYTYDLYMESYPKFSITRVSYYESRIYEITERISGKVFKFATKSCDLKGQY